MGVRCIITIWEMESVGSSKTTNESRGGKNKFSTIWMMG